MRLKYLLLFIMLVFSFFVTVAQQHIKIDSIYSNITTTTESADTTPKLIVEEIIITGNKRTKDYIILREMQLKVGDSIRPSRIRHKLTESRNLIYNTDLFSIVELTTIFKSGSTIAIQVHLVEKWYIYPTPEFRLADRNFNDWWKTNNANLDRVTYGIKFSHYNLSGRDDELNIYLLNGYSRNFSISYYSPYTNKNLTERFSLRAGFSQNREIGYKTSYYNKALAYKNKFLDKTSFFIGGAYKFRSGFYKTHSISIQYNYTKVNDTIISATYNPNYFNSDQSNVSYLDLGYNFKYVKTDNINYPLRGKIYEIGFSKKGLGLSGGINMLSLGGSYKKYYKLPRRFYSSIQLLSNIKLPFRQAYINQGAMGYGNFYLSGLEYYIIDGVANAIAKLNTSKKIIDYKIPLPFKSKAFPYLPICIFTKAFIHTGYAYNLPEFDTRLNNRLLVTYGLGIDVLTLYDFNFNLEYSFNQLGEKGLFLHFRGSL